MCGICGIVAPGRLPETETVERMAAELDHRGPDGAGSYAAEGVALGFRRLAIIDLSDAGDQPFASEDGALQLVHTEETFYAGIRKLPPAHSLVFDEHGLRLERYWRLEPHDEPERDAADEVRELFLDSVRLRLRSDVPVGTALSGGLDSSAIAVCVDRLLRTEAENAVAVGSRQRTFTAYFEEPGFDERPYARAVVERTHAEPHWISFSDDDLLDDLPRIVEAQGEPFGSTSICAGWYVMREAKRSGLTVMLDGQGGDEVLAGYRAHLGHRLADLLAQGRLGELRAELANFRSEHSAAALLTALSRPFAPESLTRLVRARPRGSAVLVHPDLRGL